MKILVTGATGTVGSSVVRLLEGTGNEVRALVRDPGKASLADSVEVVQGDLTSAQDVRRALDGVDRAFLNMADDNGQTFAEVAGEVGLAHVVLLSSFTAVVPLPLGDANIVGARHRAGEQALLSAGVPSTFLRAAGFDYNILAWASEADAGVVRAPYLDVALPVVDPDDIAASVAAVLLADVPQPGAFSITGPEALTVADQTAVLSEVLGRDLRVEQITEQQAKEAMFPAGTPDVVTASVLGTMSAAAAALPISGDVEKLTGRPAHTFLDWATDHATAFG